MRKPTPRAPLPTRVKRIKLKQPAIDWCGKLFAERGSIHRHEIRVVTLNPLEAETLDSYMPSRKGVRKYGYVYKWSISDARLICHHGFKLLPYLGRCDYIHMHKLLRRCAAIDSSRGGDGPNLED